MAEPITLQEAKVHLHVVLPDEDDYITSLIVAARQMVEGRTQRALVPTAKTVVLPAFTDAVPLPGVPFVDVVEVTYIDQAGAPQTLAPSVYEVYPDAEPARLHLAYGASWPSTQPRQAAVRIAYSAGYATPDLVPAPLKQWMLLAIGALYENREQVVAGVNVQALPDSFMSLLWQPYMVYL